MPNLCGVMAGGPAERVSWLPIGWLFILTDFSSSCRHIEKHYKKVRLMGLNPMLAFPQNFCISVSSANKVSKKSSQCPNVLFKY
jgi:hypothetical protein